jgi:hypothetical protein
MYWVEFRRRTARLRGRIIEVSLYAVAKLAVGRLKIEAVQNHCSENDRHSFVVLTKAAYLPFTRYLKTPCVKWITVYSTP